MVSHSVEGATKRPDAGRNADEHNRADAETIALDLRRYLADRPVLARSTSRLRRLRLFGRRNAAPLRRIGAALLLLAGLTTYAWTSYHRSEQHRLGAESSLRNLLELSRFMIDEIGAESDPATLPELLGRVGHRPHVPRLSRMAEPYP